MVHHPPFLCAVWCDCAAASGIGTVECPPGKLLSWTFQSVRFNDVAGARNTADGVRAVHVALRSGRQAQGSQCGSSPGTLEWRWAATKTRPGRRRLVTAPTIDCTSSATVAPRSEVPTSNRQAVPRHHPPANRPRSGRLRCPPSGRVEDQAMVGHPGPGAGAA
jgi:hypothetical protein